jgi:hypothetical protein
MSSALLLVAAPLLAVIVLFLIPRGRIGSILVGLVGAGIAALWVDWLTPPAFIGSTDTLERQFLLLPLVLVSAGWIAAALRRVVRGTVGMVLGLVLFGAALAYLLHLAGMF